MTPIQAAFAVARNHLRPPLPLSLRPRAEAFLKCCWNPVAALRPSFEEILDLLPQVDWEDEEPILP